MEEKSILFRLGQITAATAKIREEEEAIRADITEIDKITAEVIAELRSL